MTRRLLALVVIAILSTTFRAAEPIHYRFAFPAPANRWMEVEATYPELDDAPLELRMSRSSPGRYATHEFAKQVSDIRAYAPDGRELRIERTDRSAWRVSGHSGTVRIQYRISGDRVDGTYLAVDRRHAHVNMPAAVVWAVGLEDRPITLSLEPPADADWQIATQLYAGETPTEFSAPNLQYLIDSPIELGPLMVETFAVGPRTFRFAAHHTGTRTELQAFVKDVAAIVREQHAIYGEFPVYEPGAYTFLADYVPYALVDAMEHRNSTVLTWPATIATSRTALLEGVSHEFFHSWNVERIRPRSLEPFDLTRANPSSELWLAEGFTQYYGPLVLQRVGFVNLAQTARTLTTVLNESQVGSGRLPRSAEEISLLAATHDGPEGPPAGAISYYYLGAAIALALDLSLRERTQGTESLDDFMREMWVRHGRGDTRPGYVDRPYTSADVETALARVSGDRAFAREFLTRYVRGREFADYRALLAQAGFLMRQAGRGRVEVLPAESASGFVSAAQQRFREGWLGPQ
jgi:predicted metalloprotease with PDZ domain